MKVLVTTKRVVDYNVAVFVKKDQTGVEIEHAKKSINPFDAIAVEEAIRLKENSIADEVIAVSIGTEASQETLRQALAMGADRAILITSNDDIQGLNVAKILAHIVKTEQPDLILMGKQAIDDDRNQTGQMLAALLDWPQGCFISSLSIENNEATVEREIDEGLETIKMPLPCVLTCDLRLNEPRFAKLPDIVKSKRKPLETHTLESLGIDMQNHQTILHYMSPPKRKPGTVLDSVDALLTALKEKEVLP